MPDLGDFRSNRRLYLAFLLAIWDGEGKQGETRITSSSRVFLEEIKNLFNVPYDIHEYGYNVYYLYLCVKLMREMLESY